MSKLHSTVAAMVLAATSITPLVSHADVWAEREALAAISQELRALENLVADAEDKRSNSRTHFRYRTLLSDLRKIRFGIDHHLTQPLEPIDPVTVTPMDQAYTGHDR